MRGRTTGTQYCKIRNTDGTVYHAHNSREAARVRRGGWSGRAGEVVRGIAVVVGMGPPASEDTMSVF